MIEILKAILIGIIQGITEWLPVSSTGHMILLNELIQLNVSDAFMEMFLVVIQLGSIMAVVVLYFSRLNPFSRSKSETERRGTWMLWLKVIVAVIPSAVLGFLLDDWFDAHFYNYITVACALIFYGVLFIVIERLRQPAAAAELPAESVSFRSAFATGLFQTLALIPGTSRSGSTIIGAMLIGLPRTTAAEFSFFMAIPTMLGASALKVAKFVIKGTVAVTGQEWVILLVGCAVAFLVSLAAIRALMNYVRSHSFSAFGVYRIVLGVVVIVYFLIRG